MKNKNETSAGGFFVKVSAPAQRALANSRILNAKDLSSFSKMEILKLHGVGPGAIPKLEEALKIAGLSFKRD